MLLAILFLAPFIFYVDLSVGQVGVCNGMLGSSLPSPSEVVALYNRNNIRRMRIYAPDQPTLQALAGSDIELILDVPNHELPGIAASRDQAYAWVRNNVVNHPTVRFRYISVGNEVSPFRDESRQYVNHLLAAMSFIYDAVQSYEQGNRIRVSTAIDTGLLESSYPPSNGRFFGNATSFIRPIIQFLANRRQPLLANIYPYFAYTGTPGVDLGYALFTSEGIDIDGVRYQNLFYAMLDAMYVAVEREGGSSLEIVVSESGWPSAGGTGATMENARTYNTHLVGRMGAGTPRRPGAIEAYIFAMFDEDQKPGPPIETNFGLFRANGESKYPGITFN